MNRSKVSIVVKVSQKGLNECDERRKEQKAAFRERAETLLAVKKSLAADWSELEMWALVFNGSRIPNRIERNVSLLRMGCRSQASIDQDVSKEYLHPPHQATALLLQCFPGQPDLPSGLALPLPHGTSLKSTAFY